MFHHATMNRAFRLVWSDARQAYVAVAETATGRSKSSCSVSARAARTLALTTALFAPLLPADAPSAHTTLDGRGTLWCLAAALAWTVPLMQGSEQGWNAPLLALLASAPAWSWGLWRHCQRLRAA